MVRSFATLVICALVSAPLRADVIVVSTVTVEGGAAAMMGTAMPRLTIQVKGLKMRTDIEAGGQTAASIADVTARQMIVLRPDQKTAQLLGTDPPADPTLALAAPKVEATARPTGQSRTIDAAQCDEYAVSMSMDLSEMSAGGGIAPELAEAMKGVRLVFVGSTWVARSGPGVAEYVAFQKASADANMTNLLTGALPGLAAASLSRLMTASASTSGLPYLSEMAMSIEGTGPLVDLIKQLGAMKITTKVTSIATDPISDDVFKVPDGYTIKQ